MRTRAIRLCSPPRAGFRAVPMPALSPLLHHHHLPLSAKEMSKVFLAAAKKDGEKEVEEEEGYQNRRFV